MSHPLALFTNAPPALIFFKRLIRKIGPDVLHLHYITDYGLLTAFCRTCPFVATAWGSDVRFDAKISKISKWSTTFTLKKADLITCDAEHLIGPLIQLGANPQKIRLVYFGVDTQKFCPGDGEEKLKEELGIASSPTIISLRSLQPIYDVESLIVAASMVLKEIPEAKFLIAGKGPQETKLKEFAKSLEISGSIKFLGHIPNDELPRYLTSADVYVSTSLSDAGLAASTAEAMACELPVIVTDFGDNRKWVQDGENGYVIPLKSPEILASRIIHLIRNREVREEFGRINRQIIEKRNNWEKEMKKMEELYEELIERSKR